MGLAERLLGTENAKAKISDFTSGIKSLIDDLTAISPNIKVYVFGSISQGTMTIGSDIDLLVVVDKSLDKKEFRKSFYKIKRPIGRAVDIIFKYESEMTENSYFIESVQSDLVEVFPNWKLNG